MKTKFNCFNYGNICKLNSALCNAAFSLVKAKYSINLFASESFYKKSKLKKLFKIEQLMS